MTDEQKFAVANLLMTAKELHHGDCVGSDAQVHRVAKSLGCRIVLHAPLNPIKRARCDADSYWPERPYIERDHDIVDATDSMIATPAEFSEQLRSGTWATIRYARKVGRQVTIVYPYGSLG